MTTKLHNDANGYGAVAMALHWTMAVCVLTSWLLGQTVDAFGRDWEPVIVYSHLTLGVAIVALLAVRIAWRLGDPPPAAIPSKFDPWMARAATAGHWLLYALLVAIPVSGIVHNFARGQALPLFGLYEIASPWARDRAFVRATKEIHELLSNLLLFVALGHAAMALAHHHFLKDGTLRRMLPR
ncbi:MAG: cytochrome b [Proteobacteria bacterium]|nr:cytochrome b [Pseudomonadota bacterium]